MDASPPYWPATSSQSPSHPTSSNTLLDDAAYSSNPALLAAMHVPPAELPALVAGKITQPVIDYLVDRVCDAVDFGLGRPSASSMLSRNHSRRWQSDEVNSGRAAFTAFVIGVLRRAEVTLCGVIGALVYIDRARPHLSIAIEEWAHHRVLLGALITASKYLNDASLKNAHWALCTGVFGRRDVQRIEREFIDVLEWQLAVSETDLVRVCSGMAKEGALVRPSMKAIGPAPVMKEMHMEVNGRAEKKREGGSLRAVRALWDEEARREQMHHHRPEKRAQADVDMDVDDYVESRARRRRGAYPSPASSDSCSTCTISSSPDTDSDGSGSPCTPPPPHQAPRGHYNLPNHTAKSIPNPTHIKSASNGSMTFQPLAILDAFPAVPAPAPEPVPALSLSPSPSRSRAASLTVPVSVQVPTAPPPLPSLPPYPVFPINRAFLNSHMHLHQRPHSARPASPYAKLSVSAGPGTGSRPRAATPYAHKRSSALSMSMASALYPSYIPAVNV